MKQPCPVPFSQAAKKDRTTAIPAGLRCCPVPVQSGRDRESSFQESRKTPVIKKKAMPGCFFCTTFNYTEKKKNRKLFFQCRIEFFFSGRIRPVSLRYTIQFRTGSDRCTWPYRQGLQHFHRGLCEGRTCRNVSFRLPFWHLPQEARPHHTRRPPFPVPGMAAHGRTKGKEAFCC